ncbi:MAG: DUF5329 family protein [Candidatus Omnitrophica bacterium]|nr:DUF5329 family protein [Candidatus Omnitrophota bacterium]
MKPIQMVMILLALLLCISLPTDVLAEPLTRERSYLGTEPFSLKQSMDWFEHTDHSYKNEITYLINLIEHSPLTFIRNGKKYDGEKAGAHLKKKWEAKKEQITSTEAFIEKVASHSWMSGKPYQIEYQNHETIPLKSVLYNELLRLHK